MKLYLDTSVYEAAWLSESKRLIYVPYHFNELKKLVKGCMYSITATRLIENEIKRKYPFLLDNWNAFIQYCDKKIILTEIDSEVNALAEKLEKKHKQLHFPDSLHLAAAVKNADFFVTVDAALKEAARREIEVRELEELI